MSSFLHRVAGSWWMRLLVTGAILAYLARHIDMSAAAGVVWRVSPGHLGAVLALVALDRVVMIVRWVSLLRAARVRISASEAASIFLVSSFVGSFLPAGVGGDLARTYGVTRAGGAGSDALASVAIDRVLGILALVLLGTVGLALWAPAGGAPSRMLLAAGLLLTGCVAALWADRVARILVPAAWHRSGIGRRLVVAGDAIARYRGRPGVLLLVFGWSLVVQLLRILQAYLLGLGLGIAVPFVYYVLVMPLGLLMLLVPVSVSGFGLPQGVIVWLMRPVGVADEVSFALSTLIVLTGLAGNLPGLVLWLGRGRPDRWN
ncbi:MAG: lysylphosphatidylglycerol synthase transmembrane domain-containing protein [Acidobacteriota bacterium]